jgi:hypothetical protein
MIILKGRAKLRQTRPSIITLINYTKKLGEGEKY